MTAILVLTGVGVFLLGALCALLIARWQHTRLFRMRRLPGIAAKQRKPIGLRQESRAPLLVCVGDQVYSESSTQPEDIEHARELRQELRDAGHDAHIWLDGIDRR